MPKPVFDLVRCCTLDEDEAGEQAVNRLCRAIHELDAEALSPIYRRCSLDAFPGRDEPCLG